MRIIRGEVLEHRITNGEEILVNYMEIAGKSTETKPVGDLATGSVFHEIDTGTDYYYDEDSMAWLQVTDNTVNGATVTLGTALTYNGTLQTQTVSTVKVGTTTLTAGTHYNVTRNKAQEAGDYTLYIVGIGTYGGVCAKAFTVGKAAGSVAADPDTMSLTYLGESDESELTVTGDGAVSVASSDEDVAAASLSGDVVTVRPVGAGSATVTVTKAAGDNYLAATETISVTVAKAEGSVELESETVTLEAGGDPLAIEVTVVGDGNVTTESSDTTVATVSSVSQGMMTLTPVAAGTATVTVTLAAGDNYLGDSATVAVTVE